MIPLIKIKKLKAMSSQRIESYLDKRGGRLVRIYSGQWGAYWRQSKGGYANKEKAGVFTLYDAYASTYHCGLEKEIYFEFVNSTKINRYLKVSEEKGGHGYVIRLHELGSTISAMIENTEDYGEPESYVFTVVQMTEVEFQNIPEFDGF